MKLQNMSIIFAIIILPITIITSIVINNKISAMKKEIEYNKALTSATFDAIKAFQYNSAENKFTGVADSLKRDVNSTINTFMTSLALNLQVSGAGTNWARSYMPALALVMYDGYYIYTPQREERE